MLHTNLLRIMEKGRKEGNQEVYQTLLQKFVALVTYENTYLMNMQDRYVVLRRNGEDMFIDCGGFGIIVDKQDKISIHT